MGNWTAIIRFESIEAFQEHDEDLPQKVEEAFKAQGASDFTPFVSAQSLPPIHFTSFETPDNVSQKDLEENARNNFPENIIFDFKLDEE